MRTTVLKQRTFLFDTHFNQIMSHIVMSQCSKFQQKVDACLFISSQNDHDDSSVLWVTDGLYRVRLKDSFLQPKVHNTFGNKSPSLTSEGHKSQKGSGKKDVRCRCQRSDTLRGNGSCIIDKWEKIRFSQNIVVHNVVDEHVSFFFV